MQYDKTTIKGENIGFEKKIFLSSAGFKYPTLKLKQLKTLDVKSIADDDCILFMWTTGPQLANSVELGEACVTKVLFVTDAASRLQRQVCVVIVWGISPLPLRCLISGISREFRAVWD